VVLALAERGDVHVLTCETRPLLQGARLTTWELAHAGIPHALIVDSAAGGLIARGEVDAVIVGADRICANGDVVNKVGTYAHALGAAAAGIPFIVVAPESTVDMDTPSGDAVEIEDRGASEVLSFQGRTPAPAGADAVNPAFDVTPHAMVTAIVTDRRVIRLGRYPATGRSGGADGGDGAAVVGNPRDPAADLA
jgi:methylthioribose-1-phosphate isomerase